MSKVNSAIELFKSLAFVVVLAILIRHYLVQTFVVEGSSMEPNFISGQYILVDKVSFRFRSIERGEVVVFEPPNRKGVSFIKRVVGLPGETLEVKDGQILVNSRILKEDWTVQSTETFSKTDSLLQLKQDQYFLLGDNRPNSEDSRRFGAISKQKIIGRSLLSVWPLKKIGLSIPNHKNQAYPAV